MSVLIAIPTTMHAFLTEHAMKKTGATALSFQTSVSGPRTAVATFISAMMIMKEPELEVNISPQIYSIFLLCAVVSCDLVCSASQYSMIARTSAISFLITKQFCQIMFILLGNTLNPTRFANLSDALFSFIGFSLAFLAQLLFFSSDEAVEKVKDDTEPFNVNEINEESTE